MVDVDQRDDRLLDGEANHLDLLHNNHRLVPDVRIRRRDSKVEDYDVLMVGEQKVIVPKSIRVQSFFLDGKLKPGEESIKLDSVNKISKSEMAGQFTLSDSQSPEIFDVDLHTYIKQYQEPASNTTSVSQGK